MTIVCFICIVKAEWKITHSLVFLSLLIMIKLIKPDLLSSLT